mmetsp:Transcript_19111/g.47959  ORF Transcript_19111/g.47959 Transcript_19111/m.47959 type:complete len:108 (+) Transcript_19111:805-1128(+)
MVCRASTKATERDWALRKPSGDPGDVPASESYGSARTPRVGLEIWPRGDGRECAIAGDGPPMIRGAEVPGGGVASASYNVAVFPARRLATSNDSADLWHCGLLHWGP